MDVFKHTQGHFTQKFVDDICVEGLFVAEDQYEYCDEDDEIVESYLYSPFNTTNGIDSVSHEKIILQKFIKFLESCNVKLVQEQDDGRDIVDKSIHPHSIITAFQKSQQEENTIED